MLQVEQHIRLTQPPVCVCVCVRVCVCVESALVFFIQLFKNTPAPPPTYVEALTQNATLEMLSISGNYVGGMGASALANGLKVNTSLKGLQINGNDIGNEGARKLCEGLAER